MNSRFFFLSEGKGHERPLMPQMKLSCAIWSSGMKTTEEKANYKYLRIKTMQIRANSIYYYLGRLE